MDRKILSVQFVCKGIFVILKLMIHSVYINALSFCPVKHKIAVV